MNILWVNPSFLDYRIPLYEEMQKLCGGTFYLIYSKKRMPDRCHCKIQEVLGNHALFLENEKRLKLGRRTEFANTGIALTYPKGLYKLIKKVNPDLIIAEGFFQFTPWAVWYSLFHHIPLLIAYERTAHTERNCPLWRRMYRRFIGLFTNGYVANGILTKQYLVSQGVKAENIFTGGMCADSFGLAQNVSSMDEKDVLSFKQQVYGDIPSGVSFVFVGRMIPLKGGGHLLQGWKRHIQAYPNDRLLLVGDGPELPKFKKEFGNDNSVIFTGGIDYSMIYKYYAISDVFIIPTLEDNWSLVVPEAMACGLPVACSIYNGCYPELVHKDVNGTTFDPLNQDSITEALQYFHTIDLEQFGKHSIEIEKEFNPHNTALNVLKAVEHYLPNFTTK